MMRHYSYYILTQGSIGKALRDLTAEDIVSKQTCFFNGKK